MNTAECRVAAPSAALSEGLIKSIEQFIHSIAPSPQRLRQASGDELLERLYKQVKPEVAEFVESHVAEIYLTLVMAREGEGRT